MTKQVWIPEYIDAKANEFKTQQVGPYIANMISGPPNETKIQKEENPEFKV